MNVLRRNIDTLGGPSNIVKLGLGMGCYPPERQDRMQVRNDVSVDILSVYTRLTSRRRLS